MNLVYVVFQIKALMKPLNVMHFRMNLLYSIVSLIIGLAYCQVIFESEEGSITSFFMFAFNLHWFRMLVKMLDLEGLGDNSDFSQ